jgi:Tfp pilus assembly protein PilF
VANPRIEQLRARVEADGLDTQAHFGLGGEYLAMGECMMAVAEFRRCVEIDPQSAAAWRLLGDSYASIGVAKEAASAWRHGALAAARQGDTRAAGEMGALHEKALKGELPAGR